MVYVVSNFKGYLTVDSADVARWVRSPFNADKFSNKENAERNAQVYNAVVVEISDL